MSRESHWLLCLLLTLPRSAQERSFFATNYGACWNHAEANLLGIDSDVLGIFDCCYSGKLCDARSPTRFQYLAACAANQKASNMEPGLFTKALVQALKDLKADSLSTSKLLTKIVATGTLREDSMPLLAPRIQSSRQNIVLAAQEEGTQQNGPGDMKMHDGAHYFDVRFHREKPVDEQVIIQVAEHFKSFGLDPHLATYVTLEGLKLDDPRVAEIMLRWSTYATHKKDVVKRCMARWRQIVQDRRGTLGPEDQTSQSALTEPHPQ